MFDKLILSKLKFINVNFSAQQHQEIQKVNSKKITDEETVTNISTKRL